MRQPSFLFPFLLRLPVMAWLLLIGTACGLLGESEQEARIHRSRSASADCAFPKLVELTDAELVRKGALSQALDCMDRQIDTAFSSIQGEVAGELSSEELRKLQESGVVKLPWEGAPEWSAFGALLTWFHPSGKPAISRAEAQELVRWARSSSTIYLRLLELRAAGNLPEWAEFVDSLKALEGLMQLLSDHGQLGLGHALAIADGITSRNPKLDPVLIREQVKAGWILKALVLRSAGQSEAGAGDFGAELRSSSLKELLQLGIKLAQGSESTFRWIENGLLPQESPKSLPQEWEKAARTAQEYFYGRGFEPVDVNLLQWSLKVLAGNSGGLSALAPELVRLSTRLSAEADLVEAYSGRRGLHPSGFAKLLDALPGIAEDLLEAAQEFKNCKNAWDCSVTIRAALQSKSKLKRVALKGRVYPNESLEPVSVQPSGTPEPRPSPPVSLRNRLEGPVFWWSVGERIIESGLMSQVFRTFDRDGDGKIELEAKDTREAVDLAFTFLKFATAQGGQEEYLGSRPQRGSANPTNRPSSKEEDRVEPSYPLAVKPSALYRTLGLIGDRWMPDGNGDKAIDADEFYSIIKVYEDIQNLSRGISTMWGIPRYSTSPRLRTHELSEGPAFSRTQFVRYLSETLRYPLPHFHRILSGFPSETRDSLFHSLISRPDLPLEVYEDKGCVWDSLAKICVATPAPPMKVLREHVRGDAALGPAAVLSLLDRLMIRCDSNEDGYLDWKDLDCAMPLVLEGALRFVSSELVDLDPGVHDGSKKLLEILQGEGIPLALTKLAAISGSVRDPKLPLGGPGSPFFKADWAGVARLIGAPLKIGQPEADLFWAVEARKRFSSCDLDGSESLSGMELECLTDRVFDQIETFLARVAESGQVPWLKPVPVHSMVQELRNNPTARMGIQLATQSEARLNELMGTCPEACSSVEKILKLVEETIRRSLPLCQDPDC